MMRRQEFVGVGELMEKAMLHVNELGEASAMKRLLYC